MKYLWISLICFIIAALIWTDHNFTKIQIEITELRQTQELMKEENRDCLIQALETIKEAREIAKDAFKDKLLNSLGEGLVSCNGHQQGCRERA